MSIFFIHRFCIIVKVLYTKKIAKIGDEILKRGESLLDWQEKEYKLAQKIVKDNKSFKYWNDKGLIYLNKAMFLSALKAFTKEIELDPKDSKAW